MKNLLWGAVAACLIMPATVPETVRAQENQTIVVEKNREVTRWVQGVSRDLDNWLAYPYFGGLTRVESGVVSVLFSCGSDGTASNISVIRRSGSRDLDRAAVDAISHIRSLHPLPVALGPERPIRANIFFALDAQELGQQQDQMHAEAANLAARRIPGREVAITLDVRAHS